MQGQQTQGAYAPSWQALMNTGLQGQSADGLVGRLSHLKNRTNMFGNKLVMDFKYYDPRTGTTKILPGTESGTSQSSGSSAGKQGNKGAGFIKNLIAKNKQRKADKISKKYPLTQQEIEQRPDLATTQQEKEMRPDFNPYNNPNVALPSRNKITGMAQPGSFFPQGDFEYGGYSQYGYGGAPQYNYGGYPEYEEGAETEMTDAQIANYLAMGGTLEYLD